MASKLFISAKEVARELEVSDSFAYRLVRKLNDELEKQGFVVVKGKISRKYFEERVYGIHSSLRRLQINPYPFTHLRFSIGVD